MESDAGFWQIFAQTFIGYWTSFPSWQKILESAVIYGGNVFVFLLGAFAIPSGCKNFLSLRNFARESRYSQRYRDVITSGLEWLEHPERMSGPFSYRAFSICLVLAFAYPMLFWLITWVAGGSGDFAGAMTLSPAGAEGTSMWRRLLVLGMLIVLAVFYYYFFKNQNRFAEFLISHLERILHGKLPKNMAGAAGSVVVSVAGGAAGAVVAGGAGVAGGAVGAGVGFGAVGIFVVGGAVGAVFMGRAGVGFGAVGTFVVGSMFVAVGAVGTFITFVGFGAGGTIFWLTFYTLLPVVNAFFDWLSLGASRGLIRLLLDRHSVRLAVLLVGVDLALALLFMGMISLAIPFLLGAINSGLSTLENPVAIHWQATVEAARTAPWTAGLMATAMIVTTLIPTAVHLFTALVSLIPVNLSHTKLAKTSDREAKVLASLDGACIAFRSLSIPIVYSWAILVLATITLLSLFEAAHQGGLGDLLIDGALASGTFAEGLF